MKFKASTATEIEARIWNRVPDGAPAKHDPRRLLVQSIAIEQSDLEQRIKMALEGEK